MPERDDVTVVTMSTSSANERTGDEAAAASNTKPSSQASNDSDGSASGSFFSFADPGGPTWWSYVLIAAISMGFLASCVTLGVVSGSGYATLSSNAKLSALYHSQCSVLSPLRPLSGFTAWRAGCPHVRAGRTYACTSAVDCVMLTPACASPAILSDMVCQRAPDSKQGVCALQVKTLANGGFCGTAGERCAVCSGPRCLADSNAVACQPESVCNDGYQWTCMQ